MRNRRIARARRGSILVEFAVCTPLLVTVFLGAWHFGYAFWQYNALEQAVRAGGRFASVAKYKSATTTPDAAFLTAVRNVVVYGKPAVTDLDKPAVSGLTPDKVFAETTFYQNQPDTVRVWVNGFTIPGLFSTVTMNGKPSVTFPFVGAYQPPLPTSGS